MGVMDLNSLFNIQQTIPVSLAVIAVNLTLGWMMAKQFNKDLEAIRKEYEREVNEVREAVRSEVQKINARLDIGDKRYEDIQKLLVDIRVDVAKIRERQNLGS